MTRKNSSSGIVLSIVLMLLSFVALGLVQTSMPHYVRLLEELGAELPALTKFAIQYHGYGWLLWFPGFAPLAWLIATRSQEHARRGAAKLLVIALFVLVILWVALMLLGVYLPVLQLGQAVGQ